MKETVMADATSSSSTSTAEAAARISALLDQLEALVVDFPPHDPARAASVRANARFAGELVTPTITAVNNFEPLRVRKLFDIDGGRQALAFRDDFRPLAHRVAVLASQIDFAVDDKLAEAAIEALQTYQWAKRATRHPDAAGLTPYVSEMQRVVEKTLNHRAKHPEPAGTPAAAKELVTV
jgi:hypothetical protein